MLQNLQENSQAHNGEYILKGILQCQLLLGTLRIRIHEHARQTAYASAFPLLCIRHYVPAYSLAILSSAISPLCKQKKMAEAQDNEGKPVVEREMLQIHALVAKLLFNTIIISNGNCEAVGKQGLLVTYNQLQ